MVDQTYEQEIVEQVRKLSAEQQRRVLEYARGLERPAGIPGWLAIQYADEINFPPEDLAEMEKAIEEDCEIIEAFPEIDLDGGDESRETK